MKEWWKVKIWVGINWRVGIKFRHWGWDRGPTRISGSVAAIFLAPNNASGTTQYRTVSKEADLLAQGLLSGQQNFPSLSSPCISPNLL